MQLYEGGTGFTLEEPLMNAMNTPRILFPPPPSLFFLLPSSSFFLAGLHKSNLLLLLLGQQQGASPGGHGAARGADQRWREAQGVLVVAATSGEEGERWVAARVWGGKRKGVPPSLGRPP